MAELLDCIISALRRLRTLAFSTSSAVNGTVPRFSSVCSIVSRTVSSCPASAWADAVNRLGSWSLPARAVALVALRDSTSALCRRPLGDCETIPASRLSGAQSGCAAAGMW